LSRRKDNPLLFKKRQSSNIISVLWSIYQGQGLKEGKYKLEDLFQDNNSKHEEVSILKGKLEWLLPQDKEPETLEAGLEAKKELTRVKRPLLLPLYILFN
jgi:hypothetical protein